jgi:hypothetical protein
MSDTPLTPTPSAHWRVTAQQEEMAPGAAGTYTKGVRVFFQLDSGPSGSVFVPNETYTIDNVRAAILARANAMADVHALSG